MDNIQSSAFGGKRIVIIGGTAGIGKATANAAAQAGARVVVVSSQKKNVANALQELGDGHEGIVADLTDEHSISNLFQGIGNFDHLVFTAGEALQLGSLSETDITTARKFFDLRYWGALQSVKYATPYINEGGSITLTGGLAAHRPGPGWSLGASICAAMEGFTRAMAVELAPLRVNMVVPGLVRTDLWSSFPSAARDKMYADFSDALLVRKIGEPEEVAKTYLYLMAQSYSTGQCIVVDGGGSFV